MDLNSILSCGPQARKQHPRYLHKAHGLHSVVVTPLRPYHHYAKEVDKTIKLLLIGDRLHYLLDCGIAVAVQMLLASLSYGLRKIHITLMYKCCVASQVESHWEALVVGTPSVTLCVLVRERKPLPTLRAERKGVTIAIVWILGPKIQHLQFGGKCLSEQRSRLHYRPMVAKPDNLFEESWDVDRLPPL
jgi:hypothetical protein